MQCSHPLYASITRLSDGSNSVKLLPKRVDQYSRERLEELYGHSHIVALPCGKCLPCKLNYARNWAQRCVLEASCYAHNWFLTLTYDDDHLPSNPTNKEMSDFMKALRNKLGNGIRFFGCGEFGTHTKRFHMHLILFNCDIPDARRIGKVKDGAYYSSEIIEKIWNKGHIILGDVTYASCGYVARYCVKKVFGDGKGEFVLMSRKPGIGYKYFEDHQEEIYRDDKVYFNFGKSIYQSPTRFFDKCFSSINPTRYKEIKDKRISNADLSLASELFSRGLRYKEDLNEVHDRLVSDIKKRGF